MKKIIFLDVDGVLNNDASVEYYGGFGGFFQEEDVVTEQNIRWDREAVDNLRLIVENTDAKIVMSSTWRTYLSVDKFREMFVVYGWSDAPVIDRTPNFYSEIGRSPSRGIEVNAWINDNDVDRYVIIDDINQFLPDQQEFFINTWPLDGLTFDDAIQAIDILNK